MSGETAGRSASRQAGERAVGNTVLRAGGEVLGRLASLVLFAALGRSLGQSGLGVYVFALAWAQIAIIPPTLGLDRYFLRRVARDRPRVHEMASVLSLKLVMTSPFLAAAVIVAVAAGYGETTRLAIFAFAPGVLMDSLTQGVFSAFMAYERGGLLAATVMAQRFVGAALGLAALAAGMGVVAVALAFTAANAVALALALLLLRRRVAPVGVGVTPGIWRELAVTSFPFAAQDVLSVVLARLDAVLLALLATAAAVGRYGAAYRLLESTFFITLAIAGAFAAMYTYLDHDSEPTLRAVFQRSIKLSLVVMVPLAVILAVLARPLAELIFGSHFGASAPALRLLAPAVVLMSLVTLSSSLVVSRGRVAPMVWLAGAMVALNALLNAVLIPAYADRGAALAMLATEVVAMPIALVLAARRAGGLSWPSTFAGPLLAGGAMGAAMVALGAALVPAAAVGMAVYVVVLVTLERVLNPQDVEFARSLLARRLPVRQRG